MSVAAARSRAKRALAPLAILLCLAGCSQGTTPQERIRQARAAHENQIDPQIEADWQNVANAARPVMIMADKYWAEANRVAAEARAEDEREAAEETNRGAGK
ncbi:MAG: hypothetical protein JO276_05225 [Sphingomonadaceae bacterium]|nr:hypothetical protein [Sphingomonadaceae bacterium]